MKLKQLLISTASIAALAVVPMSIVSCGNNNNNSVDQLPPANGGDSDTQKPGNGSDGTQQPGNGSDGTQQPGNGSDGTQQPGNGSDGTQQPGIQYIDIEDRNGMLENILTNTYIASEFIKQVLTKTPPRGEVTYAQWDRGLTAIVPGNTSYHTDGKYYYYNIKNLTFTITAGKAALYYSVNNETKRDTISASGTWTVSVELNFRSTTKIENI